MILTQDGVGVVAGPGYFLNSLNFATSVDGQFNTASGALNTVVTVPTGTTQTFRLVAQRDGGGSPGSVFYYGNLSAMTVPFGSTGTSTAAVPDAPKRLSARG